MEEKIKEKWKKLFEDSELAEKNYDDYVQQFLGGKKVFTKEAIKKIGQLRAEKYRTKKEFWDFECSVIFPKE